MLPQETNDSAENIEAGLSNGTDEKSTASGGYYTDDEKSPDITRFQSIAQSVAESIQRGFSRAPAEATTETNYEVPSEFDDPTLPPRDKRQAWFVCFGASLSMFVAFGFPNSYGIFQKYYEEHLPDSSVSTISLIGSLQAFLTESSGLILPIFSVFFSAKKLMTFYSMCLLTSLFILSFQHDKIYKVFILQAVMYGFSAGGIFNVVFVELGQWFSKHRGAAFALAYSWVSLGGAVWPLVLPRLLQNVGYGWALRIVTLIIAVMTLFGTSLAKFREGPNAHKTRKRAGNQIHEDFATPQSESFDGKSPQNTSDSNRSSSELIWKRTDSEKYGQQQQDQKQDQKQEQKKPRSQSHKNKFIKSTLENRLSFSWGAYKDPMLYALSIPYFFGSFANYMVLNYTTTYSSRIGIAPNLAFYLITIINLTGIFGRIVLGMLSDKFGSINLTIIVCCGTALIEYLWNRQRNNVSVVVYCMFSGFTSGSYMALAPASFTRYISHDFLAQKVAFFCIAGGLGMLSGLPLAGLFIDTNVPRTYAHGAYLQGSFMLIAIIIYTTVKFYLNRNLFAKV